MKSEGFQPGHRRGDVARQLPGVAESWPSPAEAAFHAAARTLAERYGGDRGAADWRHFGRLAGLTNRKPKYRAEDGRYPFVRLVEASGKPYPERAGFLQQVTALVSKRPAAANTVSRPARQGGAPFTIDHFRLKQEYGGDGNRIDLAYAVYALSHGVSQADVRSAISSRDLSKKGSENRQRDYIERTIRKATSALGR